MLSDRGVGCCCRAADTALLNRGPFSTTMPQHCLPLLSWAHQDWHGHCVLVLLLLLHTCWLHVLLLLLLRHTCRPKLHKARAADMAVDFWCSCFWWSSWPAQPHGCRCHLAAAFAVDKYSLLGKLTDYVMWPAACRGAPSTAALVLAQYCCACCPASMKRDIACLAEIASTRGGA